MPIRLAKLSSIATSTSREITTTTTRAAAASATSVARAASTTVVPPPPPSTASIPQHFTRILSLWPSDLLRPTHLSFNEYIKARAALARSNNHHNTIDQNVSSTASPSPSIPRFQAATAAVSSSSSNPTPPIPVQADETSDREGQTLSPNTRHPGRDSGDGSGGLHVLLQDSAGEAEVGNKGIRAPAAGTGEEVMGSDKSAPVLKDINALYTLLDNRYAKKFTLSPETIHPASNPNHYDALLVELKEAPNRSWLGRMLRKIGGMVRLK